VLDLRDCAFFGHALPEPFVKLELEGRLGKAGLLPRAAGVEKKRLEEEWEAYRRALRNLGSAGGPSHVVNRVVAPLRGPLGYLALEREEAVETREGEEDGGWLLNGTPQGPRLRAFAFDLGADLDAPSRRGRAYRFSPGRIAHRVLLAKGERAGLLTNGLQLRLLLCDPARPESHIAFRLDRGSGGWAAQRNAPDSFRLLRALGSPAGLALLPDLTEAARLNQTTVTKSLRRQARAAVEGFVQELLDRPENAPLLAARSDLAKDLWREGLVLVYRLLFALKLEASADPARVFSFASTALWRDAYSPNAALGPVARKVLDEGAETGRLLEDGLRALFRLFSRGISSSELRISPLGGALFGEGTTPLLDALRWGERAVARLLVNLLWTKGDGKSGDLRVHYGTLDVEDLGRVYESLLELEPGVATEPMCRLRRQKLEVVVPLAQGEPYRAKAASPAGTNGTDEAGDDADDETGEDDEAPKGKTKVVRDEKEIRAGEFFLRVGLGRKATGSYYTPHPFVRFLVQETLGPQAAERSPAHEPDPGALLALSVLDPAMGSGHFLVEACRFLGEKLYEACRLCDELAVQADEAAAAAGSPAEKVRHEARAAELRRRVEALPDPDDLMVAYLPSRVAEGESAGLSQTKALALARRLVAVHCLYGIDKNPLAVELAKLALWLESYAEGLPLTFLDHRLICGDSLTGPFFENLLTYPGSGQAIGGLFAEGLTESLKATLQGALLHVRELNRTVGKDESDLVAKRAAKERLDAALTPFRLLAAAWSGGVMLGKEACDDLAYETLLRAVAEKGDSAAVVAQSATLAAMVETGREGVPYDLVFPEVFHPDGSPGRRGFDVVLGNPPWDAIQFKTKEFFASFDFRILEAPTKRERTAIEERLLADHACAPLFAEYKEAFERLKRANDALCHYQKVEVDGDLAGRQIDSFRVFMERNAQLLGPTGLTGVLVPSAFHANEGAIGVRQLYLERMALLCCFSFENRRKLFEIDSRFKFALVVAGKPGPTTEFPCAFYLHDMDWLFGDRSGRELRYSLDFVQRTGGVYLSLLELQSESDLDVAEACFRNGEPFGKACELLQIRFGSECHMTNDSWRFTPAATILPNGEDPRDPAVATRLLEQNYLYMHEGKTFRQYDDHWADPPRYLLAVTRLADKPGWISAARFFRLAYRNIAGPGDQNVAIWNLHSAGCATGEKGPSESTPSERPTSKALVVLASWNSYVPDWLLQLRVRATVSQFMLFATPVASGGVGRERFLSHSALRLTCNHAGYAPLWHEQVGDAWREPSPRFTWPVLEGDDARWAVRAAIDAVVADAYGLSRSQYAHVLSTFSHKSYPKAPALCLAAFDELKEIGLDAFARRHDPYHDLPLNEDLPKPVIDIPVAVAAAGQLGLGLEEHPGSAPPKRGRGRPRSSMAGEN